MKARKKPIDWDGKIPSGWADDLQEIYCYESEDRALEILYRLVKRGVCDTLTFATIVSEFSRKHAADTIHSLGVAYREEIRGAIQVLDEKNTCAKTGEEMRANGDAAVKRIREIVS